MQTLKKSFEYDYVIIGAGISGLYTGYKFLLLGITNFAIYEKSDRYGGRIGEINFCGTMIPIGAGIGRAKKDKLLKKLLNDLNIEISTYVTNSEVLEKHKYINIKEIMNNLKFIYYKHTQNYINLNFKEFFLMHYDETTYKNFLINSGYTDFEKSNILDVLEHYNMDDNYGQIEIIKIKWNKLINNLVMKIGEDKIFLNHKIHNITNHDKIFYTNTNYPYSTNGDTKIISSKNIVIATDILFLQKLLKNTIYDQVKHQPFIRIYAKLSKTSSDQLKKIMKFGSILVDSVIHRIITMNEEKRIYMIVYSDNDDANKVLKMTTTELEEEIQKAINSNQFITIEEILRIYWKAGTHYYLPSSKYIDRQSFISKLQFPINGLYVVGEAVSINQGWTEGALQSVENIINVIKNFE